MGADLLAAVRGPAGLCVDLLDCPDAVQARLCELRAIWQQCYQTLYDRLPPGNGSNCWLPAWAPGRTYPLQNDFSCMISPEMYREFFLYIRWAELDALMAGLRPEGVILNFWAPSPAEADALVRKVAAWR